MNVHQQGGYDAHHIFSLDGIKATGKQANDREETHCNTVWSVACRGIINKEVEGQIDVKEADRIQIMLYDDGTSSKYSRECGQQVTYGCEDRGEE
jgi:hypothetical protein